VREVDASNMLRDKDLLGLDVKTAITQGLLVDGSPRKMMFTDAAIAASWQAERIGVGPYPLRYLARYVRTAGRSSAVNLPEPLIGVEATGLARGWLSAASAAGDEIAYDELFARWLEMVATLITLRRKTRQQDQVAGQK
jgi:hypothetical protein